jgi:hypothetical protein
VESGQFDGAQGRLEKEVVDLGIPQSTIKNNNKPRWH